MKASIIGCGTAGLASAIFLRKLGYDVIIYDQVPDLQPVGAGLLIQPTGLHVLKQLECLDRILETGSKINALTGEDRHGKLIAKLDYQQFDPQFFGVGIHRGQLFQALYDKACESGVKIKAGISVEKLIKKDGLYALECEDSPPDLLIISNGANSHLASQTSIRYKSIRYPWGALWHISPMPKKYQLATASVEGEAPIRLHEVVPEAKRKGLPTASRATSAEQSVSVAPEVLIQATPAPFIDQLRQRYDSTKILVGMLPSGKDPVSKEDCVSFFWSIENVDYKKWRATDLHIWKKEVLSYWPAIDWALDDIHSHDDLIMATYQDNVMKVPYDKNVIVLGDAAHAMSPQLGQGANMALMDAWGLFNSLKKFPENLNQAFEEYRQIRKAHLFYYQWASRFLTPLYQSNYTMLAPLRNFAIKWGMKMPWVDKQILGTLVGVKNGLFSMMKTEAGSLKTDF